MKISSTDILRILRRFNLADETNVPRHIERISIENPSSINTSATFVFAKKNWLVLFDETASEDVEYIMSEAHKVQPGVMYDIVKNPTEDKNSYGIPYESKDCYLLKKTELKTRLDAYLVKEHSHLSRSSWKKYIKQGRVTVNGELCDSAKYGLLENDKVKVDLPSVNIHEDKHLEIIYQDNDVTVINKPHGVLSHAKNEIDSSFSVEVFMKRFLDDNYKEQKRAGIVHRLDRDTSGVMICANNEKAFEFLKVQFADRKVKKVYRAVCVTEPKVKEAIINAPIVRNSSKMGTFKVSPEGKSAQTYYKVLGQTELGFQVEATPKTGRTHQIRVHLAYVGASIVGDVLYSDDASRKNRLMLHAKSLKITLPSGEVKEFLADLPEGF